MKAAALRSALSDRARAGRIHVIDSFGVTEAPSTKGALSALSSLKLSKENFGDVKHVLVVHERNDEITIKSLRNIESVHLITADQLNTYDVLLSDDVVFTKAALDGFLAGRQSADNNEENAK